MDLYWLQEFRLNGRSLSEVMETIPTPDSLESVDEVAKVNRALDLIDRSLLAKAISYGLPYGFIQEQEGRAVQNLFPIKKHESDQISSSSKATLEMHTETAFHPWRPDVVMLLCLRGREDAGTIVATLPDILNGLNDETYDALHQPEFETSIDASFGSPETPGTTVQTSVLFNNGRSMTYDRALMTGRTERAQNALRALSNQINACSQTIYLKSGQVLTLDNRVCVHGRTAFTPRYDGSDRWLKRVMISTRLPLNDEVQIGPQNLPIVHTRF